MPSIQLADLAKQLNAELYGDGNITIMAISSVQSAKPGTITFITSQKYRKQLSCCKASAVVLTKENLPFFTSNALVVKDPYLAYAYIAQFFDTTPKSAKNIASSAIIDPSACLGNNVSIGHNTVIESGVSLGDNVIVGANCFIGKNTIIGANSHFWANITIYHDIEIGEKCLIQSGTVIGSDGFGYVNNLGHWIKIPQLGRVIIGNNVEIGAGTTIDRGALDDTIIGNGVIIDNQCQIAHNVVIGDHTAVASGVIMAGSLKIGRYCMIGGASVINGHMEICDRVTITGMGMVMRPITKPGIYSSGIPLQSNQTWRRTALLVMNIDNIHKRLKALEHKIDQ